MKKRERKAYSRDERKEQILTAFTVNAQAGLGDEMTLADIARWLKVTPSGKLRDIVTELVIDQQLECRIQNFENGGAINFRRWYKLPEDSLYQSGQRVAAKHRSVSIKSRGRSVGQMELI